MRKGWASQRHLGSASSSQPAPATQAGERKPASQPSQASQASQTSQTSQASHSHSYGSSLAGWLAGSLASWSSKAIRLLPKV
jgi:hypothetical protein